MQFFIDTELGPRQATLPSGALLCRDVTIGRTGWQDYMAYEIGVDDPDVVRVRRDADDVFDAASMGSFESVPVTLTHPDEAVGPDTWRTLAVGHATNVRRDGDRLVADLIIHDRQAIDAIRSGQWRGVSCGYDAAYVLLGKGRYRQTDIRGNHIAVLPAGQPPRCGSACYIGDATPKRGENMRRTRDDIPTRWAAALRDRNDGRRVDMGTNPGSDVGGELVMELPGERTAYYISALPDGSGVGLYRHVSESGAMSGVTTTADATLRAMGLSDGQIELRRRDERHRIQSATVMRGINQRNREYYG